MLETAFFDGFKLHLQLMYFNIFLFVVDGLNAELAIADAGHFPIVEVDHAFGMFDDGGGIRCQEKFIVANTDHQRGSFARGYQGVFVFLGENHDGVRTVDFVEGQTNGLFEADLLFGINVFDQMRQNLGVRVREELMTLVLELGLDGLVIFDNPVVYQGQQTVVPKMRVGVAVVGFTVGSPASMTNA